MLPDIWPTTALRNASRRVHTAVVKWLLQKGTAVNAADAQGWTALQYAAHYGQAAVVRQLIDAQADVQAADAKEWTALHKAAEQGHAAAALFGRTRSC